MEIYYTGHGERGTGDWLAAMPDICMHGRKDYLVSLDEVLDNIIESGFKQRVRITSDCCYSGNWCHKAKALWTENDKYKTSFESLDIYASSSPDKAAMWSGY